MIQSTPTRTQPLPPLRTERRSVPRGPAPGGEYRAGHLIARTRPFWLAFMQTLIFALVYLAAYLVRFDGHVPSAVRATAFATLPVVLFAKLFAVVAMNGHRGWWRSATFADLISLIEVASIGSALLTVLVGFGGVSFRIPLSILLLDWAGSVLALCGARAATRLGRERLGRRAGHRVLIVGANEAGSGLVRNLRVSPQLGMQVVGFLDDDERSVGRVLSGVRVMGTPGQLRRVAAARKVQTVMIPLATSSPQAIRLVTADCRAIGVNVQVVPDFNAILTGGLTVQPRDVAIHDLLCRPPVRLDTDSVRDFIRGRVVLVTGAAGSIGSEVCRQVLGFEPERLVMVDHNENGVFYLERDLAPRCRGVALAPCVASITDGPRLREIFRLHRPEVILHAAAYKHVAVMEMCPGEAVRNNVFGTRTLVEEAVRARVKALVMVSTDKAVNPTSVMGACKRAAEMVVQSAGAHTEARFVTVRFGNVLGSAGSVVPIFTEQIRKGGPVTVTHPDMTRYFMTIPEAAQLTLQAGAIGRGGEIFVLDMGEPVRVVDLARDMIRLSGYEVGREIEIVFTGLRHGEKLYEELYDGGEQRVATTHPKIFRARHRPCDPVDLQAGLARLARVINRSADEVVAALGALIPTYRPNRTGLVPELDPPAVAGSVPAARALPSLADAGVL